MPLIGKKAPSAQEIYKARRQKEDEEKDAFLPPGLVNHGNTCFMNSVLQGLIATPMLSDIVRFSLPESYLPISSRRSPQLTNGHGLAGKWEQEWDQGLPLGDVFVYLMDKAWGLQDERTRASLSPRELLARLGAKYDQYLDFRQQDAHELLRHLLDAMRMEEQDIIKRRQPPPPKVERKRRAKGAASKVVAIPEEDRLSSFVDMVFGGKLASILVCEKCKKVSCTFEDFNDLSLSIKAEDYEKERKRDRLKSLAKKLKVRGLDFSDQPRSSSVPASPTRRSVDMERTFGQALVNVDQRRLSLDAGDVTVALIDDEQNKEQEAVDDTISEIKMGDSDGVEVSRVEEESNSKVAHDHVSWKDHKEEAPRVKAEDEDGWVKLSRRISVGMGLKKGKRKGKSKDSPRSRTGTNEALKDKQKESASNGTESTLDVKSPDPSSSPATSPAINRDSQSSTNTPPGIALPKFPFPRRLSGSPSHTPASPALSPSTSPPHDPTLAPEKRPSSPFTRPKSPNPPKPSRKETEYLRRLLADVPSSAGSPFGMFRGPSGGGGTDVANFGAGLWQKLGNVQSVEECLRMFTAVEVLDGENKVGCHRCWKIQHGEYTPRGRSIVKESWGKGDADERDDRSSSSSDDETRNGDAASEVIISPASTPITSNSLLASSLDLNEGISVKSAPTTLVSTDPASLKRSNTVKANSPSALALTPGLTGLGINNLSVPLISMTAPETAPFVGNPSEKTPATSIGDEQNMAASDAYQTPTNTPTKAQFVFPLSPSRDSLRLPLAQPWHVRHPAGRRSSHALNGDTSSPSSDESSDELETETSMTASILSDSSSAVSEVEAAHPPSAPPVSEPSKIPLKSFSSKPSKTLSSGAASLGVPRAKQVVFRRSYKRYLIATPPPVLVVHLKRFQQVGRSPMQLQFFANFRKLDDAVSFPEYLDLSPYLLPRKGDFGLGRESNKGGARQGGARIPNVEKERTHEKTGDKCLYRLYAVVVHIGSMLGGHYIAYTALPESASPSFPETGAADASPSVPVESSANPHPQYPRTTSFESTADPKARSSHAALSARKWCYVSDTTVRLTTLEEVLKAKAYICMYERI